MAEENTNDIPTDMQPNFGVEPSRTQCTNKRKHCDYSPLDFGPPSCKCVHCGAIFWYEERIQKSKATSNPIYSNCCQHGKVVLPYLKEPPDSLAKLFNDVDSPAKNQNFKDKIRIYYSMFAFTSMGGKFDRDINKKPRPYVFKLCGQSYHLIGSLLPLNNDSPEFAQLYIYDTDNEIAHRMNPFRNGEDGVDIDPNIISDLTRIFDEHNELAKCFRMVRDRFKHDAYIPTQLRLCGNFKHLDLRYSFPSSGEIAALIVGDIGSVLDKRDIIIEHKCGSLQRISYLHPHFMVMQYPVLFPYGESGYTLDIPLNIPYKNKSKSMVSMRQYYAFRLQQRLFEGKTLLMGGRLLQQYIVDALISIEENRLGYLRNHQDELRSEFYYEIEHAFKKGVNDSRQIGKTIILPSSYTGSPRYMIQNYHDAMAICKFFGQPDLFITFTCNPQWSEILYVLKYVDDQRSEDRPDIVSRVFSMKFYFLMQDLTKNKCFGNVVALVYTVEFQKRGLPHVHILLWLDEKDKIDSVEKIDNIISAELPDIIEDPDAHEAVVKFNVHGPCGLLNTSSPCMVEGKCKKNFPKDFQNDTVIDGNGFVLYRRRNNKKITDKNGKEIHNGFVVPYNRNLLVKYQAHINVEYCYKSMFIKYLFKYVNKGPDRIRATIVGVHDNVETNDSTNEIVFDEIKDYLDCRYLSAHEAIWRIYEFHINHKHQSVERLVVHLEERNQVMFRKENTISQIINNSNTKRTMFTAWMETNQLYEDARELSYIEFPTKWVWNQKHRTWTRRKKGMSVGRIFYVHPSAGELFYLRILLNIKKGPRSYEEIHTIDNVVYDTFQQACNALGLLGDDREWNDALNEASIWATSSELRDMFCIIILFNEVGDPNKLFDAHWMRFADDIIHQCRASLHMPNLIILEDQLKNQVLQRLEIIFAKNSSSLSNFNLPMPNRDLLVDVENRLILEELSYNAH